jgi:hypothetical protein
VLDRRTKAARRYAELIRKFTAEYGGDAMLTEASKAMIAQLAGAVIQSEAMQAAIVRGESVDSEQLVRVANLVSRTMRELGLGKVKAEAPQRTLADKLAEQRGAAN